MRISYGTGCFEGIRAYYNAEADQLYIFRALEHFERLHRSCKIMNIRLPWSAEELVELTVELIRRNGLREDCYIRPFAYKADEIIGVKLNGLRDDYTMFVVPMGEYVSTSGLRCMVSSWRRVDDNMIPARAKISGAYVNSAFAKSEALMGGYDEAIMLTQEGHVSEGSAENIFMVMGGELVTPPPSENILQGITRDTVIQLARREMEMLTRERVIDRTELYIADEIFLTGTGAQIAPVVEVDHRPIGAGVVGRGGLHAPASLSRSNTRPAPRVFLVADACVSSACRGRVERPQRPARAQRRKGEARQTGRRDEVANLFQLGDPLGRKLVRAVWCAG